MINSLSSQDTTHAPWVNFIKSSEKSTCKWMHDNNREKMTFHSNFITAIRDIGHIYNRDYKFHLSQEMYITVCYHILKLCRVYFYFFLVYIAWVLNNSNLYDVMIPVLLPLPCKLMFLAFFAMHNNLTDRTHYVSLSNHWSVFASEHPGIPQGSFLRPMLFTMNMKPLSAIIDSHSVIHHILFLFFYYYFYYYYDYYFHRMKILRRNSVF